MKDETATNNASQLGKVETQAAFQSYRIRQSEGLRAFAALANNPAEQAEAIARHYTRNAMLTLHLLKLVEARRLMPTVADSRNELIERLTDELKEAHWRDFGIELEWR